MATRAFLSFTVGFLGDGSDTTFNVNMLSGPVAFTPPGTGALSPALGGAPMACTHLSISGPSAITISSSNYVSGTGVLSITLDAAPDDNGQYVLSGIAEY